MTLKNKSYEELLLLQKKLSSKEKALDKQLTSISNKIKKIEETRDQKFMETIPKRISSISKEQWEWILYQDYTSSSVHFNFVDTFFNKLGFTTSGFWEETKQTNLRISKYFFNKKKILTTIDLISKILKPRLIKTRCFKEKVLSFEIDSWEDGWVDQPELYIRLNPKVTQKQVILNTYDGWTSEEFTTLKEFLDFYEKKLKNERTGR